MNVEQAAAEALLDQGVSVPFKSIRIPFTRRVWQWRLPMRRPRLGGQIRIARHRMRLGVTCEQIEAFTREQEQEFLARHGRRISLMIALTVCRGFISGRLFAPILAWVIREFVDQEYIHGAHLQYICLLGTRPFCPIIRSAELTNPMTPSLSRKQKGS